MSTYDTIKFTDCVIGGAWPPATPSATTLDYTIIMSGSGLSDVTFSASGVVIGGSLTSNEAVMLTDVTVGAGQSVKYPPGAGGSTNAVSHTVDFVNGGTGGTPPHPLAATITWGDCDGDVRKQWVTSVLNPATYYEGSFNPPGVAVPLVDIDGGYLSLEHIIAGRYICFASGVHACLHEDTLIETDNGTKVIRELARGDMVRTYQEGFQPISRVLRTPLSSPYNFVVIEKNALGPCVPSEKFMLTTGHPIKYGNRYVTAGVLAGCKLFDISLIYKAKVPCGAYYNLQFDKHYTFCANGVETQSVPTTSSYRGLALPEELFHDKSLYDASKIGDESTYLHSEKDLRLPLTEEDVEAFKGTQEG